MSISELTSSPETETPDPVGYWRGMYYDLLKRVYAGEFGGHAQTPDQWRPIETAPVEDWIKAPSYYRFDCLLQIPPGHPSNPPTVCAGYGYYVCAPRSKERRILRWSDGHHQRFPKYWMPMPAPLSDTSTDRPAYADPDFKYNEATGSYHRVTDRSSK